jgi:hypothetical protein
MASVNPSYRVTAAAQPPAKTIVFVTGWGIGTKLLSELTGWLASFPGSHTVRVAESLNATVLSGADALIMGAPYGSTGEEAFNATNAPVVYSTIFDWWNSSGNKFIWVGGDSDYASGEWINQNMSMILETIGSPIRLDLCAVEDPVHNCGDGYRVQALITGTNANITAIVTGVTDGVLFHGPAPVYAHNASGDFPLHNNTFPDVYNVISTSVNGVIVENSPTVVALAHNDSDVGSWVMSAAQVNAGFWNNSKILVSGASPYGDYQPMNTDEYYDVPLHGSRFVKQAILWGLGITPGSPGTPTLTDPGDSTTLPFNLQWSAAAITNGFIARYFIQVSNTTGFTTVLYTYNTTSTSYAINLAPGEYFFRVRAMDDRGYFGSYSNVESITFLVPTIDPLLILIIVAVIVIIIIIIIIICLLRRRS